MANIKENFTKFLARLKPWINQQIANIRTTVITNPTEFSITTSAWSVLSTTIGDYKYSTTLTISGITPNDTIDIIFDINSISICVAAEVAPSVDVNDGSVMLYSKTIPTNTVSGCYVIIKKQN